MITETSVTSAWTFTADGAAAINLVNEGGSTFSLNFSEPDDHQNIVPAATVMGYLEDQTEGATYGAVSIHLNFQGTGFPNGGSSTVRFSEKQHAILADCSSSAGAYPMDLGTASYPFGSLVLSKAGAAQGTDTYVIFVDTDGSLKAKNPSGVLTTLATP